MGQIKNGMGTSHIPALGAAIDQKKQDEDYWKPVFKGLIPVRDWYKNNLPDVVVIIYNDHASAFSLNHISTFTVGVSDNFMPADEGYGPRNIPTIFGYPELAWHIVEELVLNEFDISICNEMPVDHGLTVPLSVAFDRPLKWPVKVIPLCVNVIQYPQPTAKRCFKLGRALKHAIESFDHDINVMIWGTGGLSHQLQGERAGLINSKFDTEFLDNLVSNPLKNNQLTHTQFMREAGSEGIEMIMWNVMRGSLSQRVEELYRFYHVPVSNTAYGVQLLTNLSLEKNDK